MYRILTIVLICVITFGQTSKAGHPAESGRSATDLGFVIGYNYSQHVGDDTYLEGIDVYPGSISGLEGGISLRWPISDRFYVLSELLYVHGGSDEKIVTHVGNWDIEFMCNYRVSYLSMPVHIGGRLFSVKGYDVELFAGPYLAFPISGTYDFQNGINDSLETSDITSYVSTDMGFSLGEGIYRDTKFGRIGLDLRYFWGFVYSGYPTYEGQAEAPLKNLFMTVNLRWYPAF